jgi:hypothetical protein
VKKDFEKLMLDAVDEGLSSLGESSKQAIYFHLERSFDLRREEIPDRIGAFSQAMENIFGAGAGCLEVLIMQRLYEKVGGALEWDKSKGFSLVEYVTVAKRSFREKTRIKTIKELTECEEEGIKV